MTMLQQIAVKRGVDPALSMETLRTHWAALGLMAIDDAGRVKGRFLHFPRGTQREVIWHWFEAQNPRFSVAREMGVA